MSGAALLITTVSLCYAFVAANCPIPDESAAEFAAVKFDYLVVGSSQFTFDNK